MKNVREYRLGAKQALRGNWAMAIGLATVVTFFELICGMVFPFAALIFGGAVSVGYAFALVQLFRKGRYDFADLGAGFRAESFKATIGLGFKKGLYIFLWSLLFVIPGIVKSYSYAMAEFILADKTDMTGGEAITLSRKLMKGKKWKLFCLDFSFIGWILLSVLTLGILMIWIAPWMEAARAAFYESIKDELNPCANADLEIEE